MVAAVEDKDIGAKVERLSEQLSKLESINGLVAKPNVGTVSYFETVNEPQYTPAQLKSLQANRVRHAVRVDELKQNGYASQFKSMSDFLLAVAEPDKYDFRKRYQTTIDALESARKSLGLNTYEGEHGASLVLPEFAPTIMERTADNDLWSRTDNYTVSGNSMTFPKWRESNRTNGNRAGGLMHFWRGEEQAYVKSSPAVDATSLKVNKMTVLVYITEEMLADASYVLPQFVSRRVREEIAFGLGNSIVRGTGVGMPLGYLNAPATITVAAESGQTGATLLADNILKMWARRDAAAGDANYAWYVNQEVEAVLPRLELGTTGNGQPVYMPAGGISGSPYATLMGRPVIRTEFNSGLGTRGDIALVDLSRYITINKGGIVETASPHVEFLRDIIAYKFSIRVDGRPADDSPITPFQGTNTQSAFVTLATR